MLLASFIRLILTACEKEKIPSVVLSRILPQSSTKRLFHDTSGGTFRIIIA